MLYKIIFIITLLGSISLSSSAQKSWEAILLEKPTVPTTADLYHAARYYEVAPDRAKAKLDQLDIYYREDGDLRVEVVMDRDLGQAIDQNAIKTAGGELDNHWRNRANVYIALPDLLDFAEHLPVGWTVHSIPKTPEEDQPQFEGSNLTNGESYDGPGGSGIRIAIIDSGFQNADNLTNTQGPTNTINYNWREANEPIYDYSFHGTGCLESAYDCAPKATYYLHATQGGTATDLGLAINQAISDNVDIISLSRSYYNQGWGDMDNSNDVLAAIASASNADILVFNSAGNRHGSHWQDTFRDTDNDTRHEWNAPGNSIDELVSYSVNDDRTVTFRLQWDSEPSMDYYDLYLYDLAGNLLDSGNSSSTYESVTWTNATGSTATVRMQVRRSSLTNPPEFEVFETRNTCRPSEYTSTFGSTTCPSNSTATYAISVGAISQINYQSPAGSFNIEACYSSRGPTNSGMTAPDLCAPTDITTATYGTNPFDGTSAATPTAAGAVAAFWSAHPQLSVDGVFQIITRKAGALKDWGNPGFDNIYGRGGLFLFDYDPDNVYILPTLNFSGSNTLPYANMGQADDVAPSGNNAIFVGPDHTAPGSQVIDKPMVYKSFGTSSLID